MSAIVPLDPVTIRNFGNGDRKRFERYVLMVTAFLEGKPPNTRRTYRCGIMQFFELFDWISPEKVRVAHAVAFKKWLLEHHGVSESTTYCRLSAVSSLFDFLCHPDGTDGDALISSNPFKFVPRSDIQPTPYARAVAMEWKVFREIVDNIPSDEAGMRDKAILIFFAFTGRRRAEVAQLRIRDLNLRSRPRSYTVRTKGGRIQSFELPEVCYDAVRAYWIAADRLHGLQPDAGVFTATRTCHLTKHLDPDRPLSNRMMNDILKRAALRANVDMEGVRIHAIRHMAARDLDAAGVRLQDIQAFLGHASPTTTQVYLDRLSGPAPAHEDVLMRVRDAAAEMARGLVD
jgi:integrase